MTPEYDAGRTHLVRRTAMEQDAGVPITQNPIPHGNTARRLDWPHLPPMVRTLIEKRLGSAVVTATSQDAGFTPGFASVLTCADGSRHFVKAASTKAQKQFADSYRIEARRLRTLPPNAPAPRLRWVHDADDWVVLGIEYVAGRAPSRPWTAEDLAVCSQMIADCASVLTPAPGLGLATAAEEFESWPGLWADLGDVDRAAEWADLAARHAEVMAGDTLVHCDVRDDNILIVDAGPRAGSAVICDWNWPVLGAAWLDSLFLLIGPRGDGLDVEAHIAGHPLLSAVDPGHIDVVLALLLGFFETSARLPRPSSSPYLRQAQAWQADVILDWLTERRP